MKKLRLLLAATLFVPALVLHAQGPRRFQVHETSIASIVSEMKAGRLTCHALVEQYLRRIDAYDKKGPALNALVQINPAALKKRTTSIASSRAPDRPDRCTACR